MSDFFLWTAVVIVVVIIAWMLITIGKTMGYNDRVKEEFEEHEKVMGDLSQQMDKDEKAQDERIAELFKRIRSDE